MKILKDDKIYVQKNDIAYLNSSDLPIPASIFMKVFGRGITIIDDSNRYEFIEFSEPLEIEFFQSLDWIIDYDSVKDLTEDEIIELGQQIAKQRNDQAKQFNSMPESKRKQQYNAVVSKLELLDFKMHSLSDIIMLKRKELVFPLPDGVENRVIIDAESAAAQEETTKKTQEKGLKSLIKSLFTKLK